MGYIAEVFPPAQRLERLPLTRDQWMLLMAAINEIFLSVDIYLAHNINGTLTRNEWIPIFFGVTAGVLLLVAGLIALRNRSLASILATLVLLGSIVVGALGSYFHLSRTLLLEAPTGARPVFDALVWAPPFLGPLFFALVGVLGISAAWIESPPNSGRLLLPGNRSAQMPYSKTRAYFLIVSLFILAATVSSVLDHARVNLENPWVWLPTIGGVFAVVVAVTMGVIARPSRGDIAVYVATMLLLMAIGLIGFVLHINTSLIPRGTIVVERFIRGSPLLGPLLFANVSLLGLLVLLEPREGRER